MMGVLANHPNGKTLVSTLKFFCGAGAKNSCVMASGKIAEFLTTEVWGGACCERFEPITEI